MTIITLLTDFGQRDGYPGVMKGVIWKIAPEVQIADLSHEIPAQDIQAGALVLGRSAPYFPDGTIHLAVVDPGVGTIRRAIAGQVGGQYFVGPDNGLASVLISNAEANIQTYRFVHLDNPKYWRRYISNSFHGRDIFAPVAAHLACGVKLDEIGTPISDPVRLEIPLPKRTADGWIGQVIYTDHFGNLASNFDANHISQAKKVLIRINGYTIPGVVDTFGQKSAGSLVAMIDSSGRLAVSVVNGNAAEFLGARIGDRIELEIVG